jgi:predicted small secreted protein
MKKLHAIITVLALTALSVSFTGCATNSGSGGDPGTTITNKPPVINQQALDSAAIVLRNAARNAAAIAIDKSSDNRKYVTLAVTTLDTFLVGNDYSPGALKKSLEPVIKQVSDVYVGLAINTVTDLYEAFFGRYVKDQIAAAANGNALLFLTNLRLGAAEALSLTAPQTAAAASAAPPR